MTIALFNTLETEENANYKIVKKVRWKYGPTYIALPIEIIQRKLIKDDAV